MESIPTPSPEELAKMLEKAQRDLQAALEKPRNHTAQTRKGNRLMSPSATTPLINAHIRKPGNLGIFVKNGDDTEENIPQRCRKARRKGNHIMVCEGTRIPLTIEKLYKGHQGLPARTH